MNKDTLHQLTGLLKKPAFLITILTLVGIAANMVLAVTMLVPKFASGSLADVKVEQLEFQRSTLQSKTPPPKVSDQDVQNLVKQMPLQSDVPRLIKSVKDIELRTGVTLQTISFNNDNQAKQDPLLSLMTNVSNQGQGAPANGTQAQPQQQQSAGNQTQSGAATSAGANTPVSEEKVTLSIKGTYAQTVDFIKQLYELERLVNVVQWSLTPNKNGAASTLTADTLPTGQTESEDSVQEVGGETNAESVTMTLQLVYYTATGYAGKFKDLPPLQPAAGSNRKDPILSDDRFLNMLKSGTSGQKQ